MPVHMRGLKAEYVPGVSSVKLECLCSLSLQNRSDIAHQPIMQLNVNRNFFPHDKYPASRLLTFVMKGICEILLESVEFKLRLRKM